MLPPDVIDKLKREREEREKSVQVPLYIQVDMPEHEQKRNEEKTMKRVVVIDLA